MAQFFKANATARKSLQSMHEHMNRINAKLDKLKNQLQPYGFCSDDKVCNRRQLKAETAVRTKLFDLGLPLTTNCITEVDLKLSDSEERKLWADKLSFIDASKLAGLNAVRVLKRTNWNNRAFPHAHFGYNDHIDSCELLHNVGFRINGVWSVMSSLSQFPMSSSRRDRDREYQVEYLTLSDKGIVGNILITLPKSQTDSTPVNTTTTTYENWSGTPASSIFRASAPLSENPAIAAALQEKSEWREQVEDSRTVSNISIMVLSCLFTLIPLASFADVSLLALTIYTIATDIIACVPLAIKGCELLLANRIHRKTVIWAYGDVLGSRNRSLVVESWSAECAVNEDVRILGVGLLVFALIMMILGLTFELLARNRLRRRKSNDNTERLLEHNLQNVRSWTSETPCQLCPCYGQVSKRITERYTQAP